MATTKSHPNTKHGHAGTRAGASESPTYTSWRAMVDRCTQPGHTKWAQYGGAGVTVCARWLGDRGFATFLADMGERREGMTLDRIDRTRGYQPGNCRWATTKTQNRNKSNTKLSFETAMRVRALYLMGMGQRRIAKELGCSHFSVCSILYLGEWMPDD